MALDLLVNFERYSNHPVFYRTTGVFPLSVRLAETEPTLDPDLDITTNPLSSYDVTLYINGNNLGTIFCFSNETTILTAANFTTNTPSVCSISAVVFQNEQYINSFAMSAIFVSSFPKADIRLYPKNKVNEFTVAYETISDLEESPGAFFYGEGHTQEFLLSCSGFTNPTSAIWLVGNNTSNNNNLTTSVWKVSAIAGSQFTSKVAISSQSGQPASYPVAIRLYNTSSKILTSGPVITYPDLSGGDRAYYPFFASTTDPYGVDNSLIYNNISGTKVYLPQFKLNAAKMDSSQIGRFKGNIKVLTYPLNFGSEFVSPFVTNTKVLSALNKESYILLPSSKEPKPFRGYLYNPRPEGILNTKVIGSNFLIEGKPLEEEEGYWSLETGLLSTIHAYQFNLEYDSIVSDGILPLFTVSPRTYTTVTLNTSCYKEIQMSLTGTNVPADWLPRTQLYTYVSRGISGPMPYIKLYTPSYYFLRDQKIPISLTELPSSPYSLIKAVITAKYAKSSLTLTPEIQNGFLQIGHTGEVDLRVDLTLQDIFASTIQTYTLFFNNYAEIINSLDYVEDNLYKTSLTPLKLTYSNQPKLSPNEWAIADNVNSIIEKTYTLIEDLDKYTKLYKNTSKLHSWLGPTYRFSVLDPKGIPRTWQEWESNNIGKTWQSLFSTEVSQTLTWLYHTEIATYKAQDPNCFQDHCLEWRWEARKTISRNTRVTWKLTRQNKIYEKRWIRKRCENDAELLNCNIGTWKKANIDLEFFPIPGQIGKPKCQMVNALFHPKSSNIIFAHSGELNMINNSYEAVWLARRAISDDRFSFQNIAGLAVSSEGRIVVLDNILSRISVLDVITKPADLSLVISWGTYGSASNPRGFNKPRDIHIDQNNSLWVADTGNKRVKKLTLVGKQIKIFYDERFETNPPISICVDSKEQLHCLYEGGVFVYNSVGTFLFEYTFPAEVTGVNKINTSYNRECVYVTYATGVVKYFRTGQIAYYLLNNEKNALGNIIQNYKSITQDSQRNCYITVEDKIIKVSDVQAIEESKAPLPTSLYWPMSSLKVHKEEYVQPWVYLKSFHRLWDNIELIRSSLIYESKGCKSYTPPIHAKEDLVIGQNEIVTNATINRLSQQLWENMQSIIKYFDPDCEN